MKKTNQFLLACAIMMAVLSSCATECKCEENAPKEVNPEELEGYFCHPAKEGRPASALNYPEIVSMLKAYDATRIAPLAKALGYEDSRINTYDFNSFMNYLNYIKKATKKLRKKGIKVKIKGISFISAVKKDYAGTGKSYQDLIYIPTTMVKGKEVPFDPVQSLEQGRVVTLKEVLAKYGYNWIYNTKEEWENGKRKDFNYSIKPNMQGGSLIDAMFSDISGAGNTANLAPPYEDAE